MTRNRRLLAPLAVVAALAAMTAGAQADDLALDGALSGDTVDAGTLSALRGGDAQVVVGDDASIDGIAVNAGDQDAFGVIFGSATSGGINLATETFDNQRFNINAINSGNNVAMQNMMAVHVNITNNY
ncbi:MAG: hypothetical protein ACREGK_10670 [Geminicoccales bacterium]